MTPVSVGETGATITATIALTTFGGGPLPCPLTVSYEAIAGTASAGVDFRLPAGSVTFNAGAATCATRTLNIEILSDTTDEPAETFSVTLASAVGAQVGTATHVVTITDNDGPPGVNVLDGSGGEPDTGTAGFPLTFTLTAVSGQSVTVAYTTNDGTATVASDYLHAAGQITFAPGEISKTVQMFAVGDTTREIDETFTVTLSSPVNATITDGTAIVTIVDNDRDAGPAKSDFNFDGKPDLLWRLSGNALAVWLMDGHTRTIEAAPTPNQGGSLEIVGTADFYADGAADIVWRDPTTGNVSIWIMNGLTRLWVEDLTPQVGVPDWRAVAVADINGDDHPDLIWRHTEGWMAASLLVGRTMVALHLLTSEAVPAAWNLVATGDMDQDGYADLVWQNDTNGDLSWWKLNGDTFVSSAPLSPGAVPNLQWKIRGGADIDRDGMTDLLWQNTVTGEITVWFMNGTALRSSTLTNPGILSDLSWRIVAPK